MARVRELQAGFGRVLGVSVTSRCNLRCGHCGRQCTAEGVDLSPELTRRVCGYLRSSGARVAEVGITGGEPTLHPGAVRLLVEAAAESRRVSCLMTNGHWATSRASARRFLLGFPGLRAVVVSTDRYHLPFVPSEVVRTAYEAARALDLEARILVALSPRRPPGEQALLDLLATAVERPGDLMTQALKPLGRARMLRVGFRYSEELPGLPCTAQGPFVREDGAMLPCCRGIEWIPEDHPMCIGHLRDASMPSLFRALEAHPIVHFLRTWGMPELFQRLRLMGIAAHLPAEHLPFDTCHTCIALCRSPEVTRALRALKEDAWFRVQVATGRYHLLDEPRMLDALRAAPPQRA